MIPTEMLVMPWYVMAKNFGWLNSYWGIMFPGMMTGFGVFLMRQFFERRAGRLHPRRADRRPQRIPDLVEGGDAARHARAVGARHLHLSRQLDRLPVAADRDERPGALHLPVGLASFSGEYLTEWELIMAGATIATLPTLVVFVVFQRYIIRGVVLAGLKG